MRLTTEAAIREALELTKANLENVETFVSSEKVIEFIREVYGFLREDPQKET